MVTSPMTIGALLDEAFAPDGRSRRGAARLLRAPEGAARETAVRAISYDSRRVAQGSLFCCIPGLREDGHSFAEAAVAQGATALLVERPLPLAIPQVEVDSVRAALGPLCDAFYGHPSDRLKLVGVTGTNGKTTTTFLARGLLEGLGLPCGLLGTVKRVIGGREEPASRTTPEAPELAAALAEMAAEGVVACALEVSSHALALQRTDGLCFACAVFTNLTQDHLDFHRSVEDYYLAKRRLFFYPPRVAVVNVGDRYGRRLAQELQSPITYGLWERGVREATLVGERLTLAPGRSTFTLHYPGGKERVELGLPGRFNVENGLAALAVVHALGLPLREALPLLADPPKVPGRMERLRTALPFTVVVDYAHTPDSLARALEALRELLEARGGGRLICLFGAGGNRDRGKRPLMGEVAARLADLVVVTSDNPRSEPPEQIIDEILEGMSGAGRAAVQVVADRRSAIDHAISLAQEGDVVLIAGKGHEQGQEVAAKVIPFADRAVGEVALARRVGRQHPPRAFFHAKTLALACGAELLQEGPGQAQAVSIDSRSVKAGALFIGLPGTKVDGGSFAREAVEAGAWGVLVKPPVAHALVADSPGRPFTLLSHPDPLRALNLLAAAYRASLAAKVVAITGSAGKTTTKRLTASLLRPHLRTAESPANYNTEIGVPLAILNAPPESEALVLELAMRGLGQIAPLSDLADPDVGVIVNIGPVHLGLLGSLELIAQAKAELIATMRPGKVAVVPVGEALLRPHLRTDLRTVTFGPGGEVQLAPRLPEGPLTVCAGERRFAVQTPFRQEHNLHNLLAAAAAVYALGFAPEGRLELDLEPLRGERLKLPNNITLILDCYNANPLSVRAALRELGREPGRRVAVLGDMLELGAEAVALHRSLKEALAEAGVELLVAVGPLAAELARVAPCQAVAVADAEQASGYLAGALEPGDTVLLKGSRALALERVAERLQAVAKAA